jgi:hypothetical protein
MTAEAAEKSDTNPLTDLPTPNTWTEHVDTTDDFVARNTRIDDPGEDSVDGCRIRMAHTASLNANAYLAWTGIL